jgi:hypothetical protein
MKGMTFGGLDYFVFPVRERRSHTTAIPGTFSIESRQRLLGEPRTRAVQQPSDQTTTQHWYGNRG